MKENSKKQNGASVPTALKAAIAVTAILFIFLAMAVGGLLIAEMISNEGDVVQSDIGGSSNKKNNSTKDTDSVQAGIVTPNKNALYQSKISRDSYISSSNDSTANVSDIKSKSTILVEVGSNTSVAEKNADLRIYPASMTKVMTLVVVCENITQADLSKKLEVPRELVESSTIDSEASSVNFEAGEQYTIKDLIYFMVYQSDTVSSIMLAQYVAETEANFAELMNQTAKKIGMTNSHFANCTGLHDDDNYSTARDMAALMIYALDSEFTRTVMTTKSYAMDAYDGTMYPGWYAGKNSRFPHPTDRLNTVTLMGGKTGFEDIPQFTLMTYAKGNNGKEYINIIVSRGTVADGKIDKSTHISDVKKIYNTYAK